jgi:hypothetical protein
MRAAKWRLPDVICAASESRIIAYEISSIVGIAVTEGAVETVWAQYEDTENIFTQRADMMEVPVGVKKNRLR